MPIAISWRDIIDIFLVAVLFYNIIILVKGTRALPAIYGLILLILVYFFSRELGFYTLHWLLENFLGSLFIVIIVLFQRDIRQMLTEMGLVRLFWRRHKKPVDESINEVVTAVQQMARSKIGALLVLERNTPLGDIVRGGVKIDARISRALLVSIFFHNTPLHDGAVIISGGRIAAAGCILPLSARGQLQNDHGTRHRAALGVTEDSDAVVIVVSEELGSISIAESGRLMASPDAVHLRRVLQLALEL